jgi:hypothetical protein
MVPTLPNLISQILINQQGFYIDFGEHGLRGWAAPQLVSRVKYGLFMQNGYRYRFDSNMSAFPESGHSSSGAARPQP